MPAKLDNFVGMEPSPCLSTSFAYLAYRAREVRVGSLLLGGSNPVHIQSMTNTPAGDMAATFAQVKALAEAGCALIRVSAPTTAEAARLEGLRKEMDAAGLYQPLIADIHFRPEAALLAARFVQKVRINPGNYFERAGKEEMDRDALKEEALKRLRPLTDSCRKHGTAIRIGVNHGSLSPRILRQYGNTIEGMLASALDYIEVFEALDFRELVLSMKASRPGEMVRANRLLALSLMERGTPYPLHLGVTEAGSGEDGMQKSLAGIGTLLEEGLGDTIRVSLTGNPLDEIPLARRLTDNYSKSRMTYAAEAPFSWNPLHHFRRMTDPCGPMGGDAPARILVKQQSAWADSPLPHLLHPDGYEDAMDQIHFKPDGLSPGFRESLPQRGEYIKVKLEKRDDVPLAKRLISNLIESGDQRPLLLDIPVTDLFTFSCLAAPFFLDGLADGVIVHDPALLSPAFALLQASGRRITRTEYIACPSCARTDFDIAAVLQKVKEQTAHLKGKTIAVMGCIVNGPGEMAGADYGYVGAGKGKVSLYKDGKVMEKSIPEDEAIAALLRLIAEEGL